MRHIIIGTAGHIDHGKTSLVRAITGVDCDTHPEEKRRGITINNGHAFLKVESDHYLAFIDVPGHQKFINTMVAGAFGIDFVLLVIAADDGVMPQTKEHLQILSLLGVSRGAVVITKIDKVGPDHLQICTDEIVSHLKGTFLQNCHIFNFSIFDSLSVLPLISYLSQLSTNFINYYPGGQFRMNIDRIFRLKGFGTVLAGTVLEGYIRKEDSVFLIPGDERYRIRKIYKHDIESVGATKGERAALNIPDIDPERLKPGAILSEFSIPLRSLLDVTLKWVNGNHIEPPSRFSALFLCGSFKSQAKIRILRKTNENDLPEYIVQVLLQSSYCVVKGDRFIIRNTSNNLTLGGGKIVDPIPLTHRNLRSELLQNLSNIANSGPEEYIAYKVGQSIQPLEADYFLPIFGVPVSQIIKWSALVTVIEFEKKIYLLDSSKKHMAEDKSVSSVIKLNNKFSLRQEGFTIDEIYRSISKRPVWLSKLWIEILLPKSDKFTSYKMHFQLVDAKKSLEEKDYSQINYIEQIIQKKLQGIFQTQDLLLLSSSSDIENGRVIQILNYLHSKSILIKFEGYYLSSSIVNNARNSLLQLFFAHDSAGISVAQFRDALQSNRKKAITLFEYFESQKIIERIGDLRFLITEDHKAK